MKFTRLMSLALISFASMLTACNGGGGDKPGTKGDVLLYDREAYISTHKGLRTIGIGYATENYTSIKTEKGRYDCITDVKALIVGVDFTDYPAANLPKGEAGTLDDLQKAILGKTEDTGWESLKSYYNKTSYGVCNIEGTVIPEFYHTNVNITDFAKGKATGGATSTNATRELTKLVTEWAITNHNVDPKDYDANGDGFIDSVIMIYTCEPHVKKSGKAVDDDLYWAFCWSRSVDASAANKDRPEPYRFFWSSYYTFYEDGYYDASGAHKDWTTAQIKDGTATLDAHTLIHEFGHVLSLPDYYNGDYSSSDPAAYDPLGGLDMMAYNVGDHHAFSKALYGWIAPYLVYGDATVTIRSTTDTGDFIIVPFDTFDEPDREFTLLSQYLVIEFLTPTGVAYADSLDAYAGNYPIWYSTPGIRVTLVDARLGMFTYSSQSQSYVFQGFTGSVTPPSNGKTDFAADNCHIANSYNKNAKIIEILPATGVQAKYLSGNANNDCLYQKGDEFNTGSASSVFNNFMGHGNGANWDRVFGYSFTITNLGSETATIEFKKL